MTEGSASAERKTKKCRGVYYTADKRNIAAFALWRANIKPEMSAIRSSPNQPAIQLLVCAQLNYFIEISLLVGHIGRVS
jgi:hypothetical protein